MRSVSDGVRLAWRSCLSFSGEAAKKLFACPSAFHTVAHSPTPSSPSCPFSSTLPLVSLRRGCVVLNRPVRSHPSAFGEESRYPPLLPSLIPSFRPSTRQAPIRRASLLATTTGCISSFPFATPNHNITSLVLQQARAARWVTETSPPFRNKHPATAPSPNTTHSFNHTRLHLVHQTSTILCGSTTTSNSPLPLLMPIV
jgi:hypothetical protein